MIHASMTPIICGTQVRISRLRPTSARPRLCSARAMCSCVPARTPPAQNQTPRPYAERADLPGRAGAALSMVKTMAEALMSAEADGTIVRISDLPTLNSHDLLAP